MCIYVVSIRPEVWVDGCVRCPGGGGVGGVPGSYTVNKEDTGMS